MEMFCVNTKSIQDQRVPIRPESRVVSKRLGCCSGGTFGSVKSYTSAKSPITSKKWNPAQFIRRKVSIQNIQTLAVRNGKPKSYLC